MRWSIGYWCGGRLVDCASDHWELMPTDGVIYVELKYGEVKPRTIRVLGLDNYALEDDCFYAWTDPWQPHASPTRTGRSYTFDGCRLARVEDIDYVPRLDPRNIKRGLMLPDVHARAIGLID